MFADHLKHSWDRFSEYLSILAVGQLTFNQDERSHARSKKRFKFKWATADILIAHQDDPFLLAHDCQPFNVWSVVSESRLMRLDLETSFAKLIENQFAAERTFEKESGSLKLLFAERARTGSLFRSLTPRTHNL